MTSALADGDGLVVGGGTMVVPELTRRQVRPAGVVDLSRAGLGGLTRDGDSWVLGAMVTYTELERATVPLLSTVARGITGGPQIRNRGTVGGSACYANPSSDMPACLVALGARLRLARAGGVREVAAAEFFLGAFRTVREPDEVLTAIVVSDVDGPTGYLKFKLVEGSWPIVTAATVVGSTRLRVVLGGTAAVPVAVELDPPSAGTTDPAWRAHVTTVVTTGIDDAGGGWDDVLAPGSYRRRIAPVIAARSVADALGEAP
ncbi:FAD binding domain-containing protein [Actinophytocola sediminis]